MDAVKSFNDELSSIYETKPPVSRAKMTILTKKAIKGIKFYKHIVQSMEKFIQKCRPEYKVPGLYVIDSVVRQSRHQFGHEKDVFMPRLCKNIISTFKHLYKCPPEEKQRIVRVLNLWQKNNVFPPEIVQQLLAMGGTTSDGASASSQPNDEATSAPMEQATSSAIAEAQPDAGALTNMLAQLLANPNNPQIQQLTGLLSTSQQAQLQALVSQVKDHQGESKDLKLSEPEVPQDRAAASVFLPKQEDSIPPFLHSEPEMKMEHGDRPNPSFNRAVLDFDYSDDDSPKSQEKPHKPGIDLELLAKLPTVDQLKQLSVASGGLMSNGAEGPKRDADDRRRHLGHEQEIFERQINQMSSEFNDRERSQDDHSSRSTSRRRRSRSRKRSRSRSRERHKHHRRSHSRDRHKRRSRSRDRHRTSHHRHSRSEDKEQEKEREREKRGFPPVKEGCISLCSKTLWIGNLASKVSQQEIKTEVEAYGPIESINMIPPRGCVYICMEKREDASKALHKLRHTRMGGKQLKADWAPGKEVKDEFKEFWVKEHGVNYIPLEKVAGKLAALKNQGFIDVESVPESIKAKLESDEAVVSESEPPQPPVINPAGLMNPQLLQGNVPVMMRPAFPFPGMGQFGGIPQQRLPGFQLPGQRPVITRIDPSPQKAETEAKRTAEDEKLDGAQKAAAVAASIMSAVQPTTLTMAQPRFQGVGQVPVQIRMMPGMPHHQAMMPGQRIGMMPIRMGVPMQFRPGPGFARVPMAQPAMVPFQQQHMQMQRLGQPMVPPMHQAPLNLPGGPPGPRFPNQRLEGPSLEKVDERDRDEKEPRKAEELGQPPKVDEESRPPMGRLPPMPGMRMGERPPMMEGRPPMDDRPPRFGFRRSPPPGRFGFDRRGPPMEGRPRFPNRDRFPDRGMDRDDRRRDDMRRPRDRSRSRERERRDRGMRDRRFDDRERRGGFGGDWGRDRGRFGGRDDFDSGRGGRFGGGFGDRGGRMEEEISEEDLEYQKKREEVLRQRREKEDEYVVEEVDLSAFGLPSGFGTVKEEEEEQPESEKREERRERDSDRRRDRDRRDDRGRDRDRRDRRRDDRSDRDRGRRDRRRSRDRDHRDDERRDRNGDDRAKTVDEQQETKRIKLEDADNMETEPQDGANDNQIKEDPESVKQETEPSQSSEAAIKEEFAKDSAIEEEKQHSDAGVEQEFKREFEDKPQLGVAHDPGFKPEINPDLEFKPEFQEKQQLDAAADPGVEPGFDHAPEFKSEFEDEPQLDSTVQSSVTMHEPMQELEHEPLYNDAKIEPSSPPRHNDLPSEINNDVRNDDMAHESQNNKGLEPLSEEVQCKITNPDVTDVTNTNEKLVEDPPTAIEQT